MIAFNSMPSDSKDRLGSAKSSLTDEWILSKCAFAVKEVNEHFENHDFHLVTRAIRRFLYSNVCDVYLVKKTIGGNSTAISTNYLYILLTCISLQEIIKPHMKNPDSSEFYSSLSTLHLVLLTGLKLLHPLMPFLTEELYQRIPKLRDDEERKESIMIEEFPDIKQVKYQA